MKHILAATALALSLAACSPTPGDTPTNTPETTNESWSGEAALNDVTATPVVETPAPTPTASATPAATAANILTLEGLGPIRIGQPVPKDSGFASRGAQISDACTTVTSLKYPGVYVIVERNAVRRITVGRRSNVKLVEGIGIGATEKQVMADFAGFRTAPHKYVGAPGKYLTAPNADSGDPALRFEIGADGKVSLIHIGTMPVLGYVEGCG
ncbi:hypothetical protein [Sphingomonas sp. LT1P40]|uniref:hypothetical protein n=1 Tax=Alteristakelama amylovorans TaxID=3096166 RepID=UPI002FC9D646